jgi:hypothetical protein
VLERDGHLAGNIVDGVAILRREIVEVLEVLIRDDDDVAQVVGPPERRDECGDTTVLEDDVLLVAQGIRAAESKGAKGAQVPRGGVIKHLTDLLMGDFTKER